MKRFPQICLWALFAISVVIGVLFFAGGSEQIFYNNEEFSQPIHTDILLNWSYILFALTLVLTLVISLLSFIKTFIANPKKGIAILSVLIVFALLFVIGWALGSGDRMEILGYDGSDNEGFMAHYSDMCIIVAYILGGLTLLSLLVTAIYAKLK